MGSFYTVLLSLAVFAAGSGGVLAAETQAPAEAVKVNYPLAMVNVASVERLLEDSDYMFTSVDRPELAEMVNSVMFSLGDLKGLDLNKPFGAMVYVQSGLPPMPGVVGYFPVTSVEELKETLSLSAITLDDTDQEGRYEILFGGINLSMRVVGDYAFVANDPLLLDKNFPDPETQSKHLSSRYDVGASLDLKTVPKGVMQIFVQYLRTSVETDLQQRDNESDVQYSLRKAQGQSNLDLIEQLLTQGERLLLGWTVSSTQHDATLELVVDAAPESEFAKSFKSVAGKRSYFASLLQDGSPLSASSSWKLSDSTKKVYQEIVNVLGAQLKTGLGGEPGTASDPSISDLLTSLSGTVELGHLDAFMQFQGQPPHAFVLIGGVKIAGGTRFASGLTNVLRRVQEQQVEGGLEITLNALLRNGVSFHKVLAPNQSADQMRLFGEAPALYVGADSSAVWFAFGGDGVGGALKKAMDTTAEPAERQALRDPQAPFELFAHMSTWISMSESTSRTPALEAARKAFTPENDELRVDFRPTENGARIRIHLQEGYIRYVGFRLSDRVDRRSF